MASTDSASIGAKGWRNGRVMIGSHPVNRRLRSRFRIKHRNCGPGRAFKQSRAAKWDQRAARRSRNALATTLTDDNDIAAALIAGESVMPKNGYSAPAAMGTPMAL